MSEVATLVPCFFSSKATTRPYAKLMLMFKETGPRLSSIFNEDTIVSQSRIVKAFRVQGWGVYGVGFGV